MSSAKADCTANIVSVHGTVYVTPKAVYAETFFCLLVLLLNIFIVPSPARVPSKLPSFLPRSLLLPEA